MSAIQSTTFDPPVGADDYDPFNYKPSLAIDNRLSTDSKDGCAHTDLGTDNFWQAELADYSAVRMVKLYLRSDCCKYM